LLHTELGDAVGEEKNAYLLEPFETGRGKREKKKAPPLPGRKGKGRNRLVTEGLRREGKRKGVRNLKGDQSMPCDGGF